MTQLIERAAVDAVFGGAENLDAQIAGFQKALKAHAKSKGKPAPTAHGVVEVIVRNHDGKYQIVDPPKKEFEDVSKNFVPTQPPPPPPELTFEEQKQAKLSDLRDLRFNRQMEGVTYKGHPFNGDPLTLNAFMSAILAAGDENFVVIWKDANGDFLGLERSDMVAAVKLIRELTQACFNNEYRLSKIINAAADPRALAKVNITAGWPA